MSWNHSQQVTVAIVPKVSSILSMLGSSWITVEVLTGRHNGGENLNRHHPYHRLLLGMSVYDMLESGWNFCSSWTVPRGTENVYRAVGTNATCSVQGFFLTMAVAVPMYNAFLAIYYFLVVNHGMSDEQLQKRVEPIMHIGAFAFACGTALASLFMDHYNHAGLWCWIAPYPAGCDADGTCERGHNAFLFRWLFYFGPLWFCILLATGCTFQVCTNVRRLDRRTLVFRKPEMRSVFPPSSITAE